MPDVEWYQGIMPLLDDLPEEEHHRKKSREPKPVKCRLCGQLIFEYALQGTGASLGKPNGLMVKIEARMNRTGDLFLAGKILHRITEEERQPNLNYWKEHRCPGFKS